MQHPCDASIAAPPPRLSGAIGAGGYHLVERVHAGKSAAAESLLQRRLQVEGGNPRLLCAMGELTNDATWFEKAWEASGHKHAPRCAPLACPLPRLFSTGSPVATAQHACQERPPRPRWAIMSSMHAV